MFGPLSIIQVKTEGNSQPRGATIAVCRRAAIDAGIVADQRAV